uniref:Uncharacterized protein n=1 Tax=Arion vulgaris TaxID=1028688 RepID=A0A0B6YZU2_9EUPU
MLSKLGAAECEHFAKDTGHLTKKHRRNVISHANLMTMLDRRLKHLSACPECCDDGSC